MGIIYKISHTENDHVYIGQTVRKLEVRWNEHLKGPEVLPNYPLYRAMNKYGKNKFSIEIIENDVPKEKLDEREIYWISFYDSYRNGYNQTLGGKSHFKYNIDEQEVYDMWDSGMSIKDISIFFGCESRTPIKSILYKYENYDKEKSKEQGEKVAAEKKFKAISQWTLEGKHIADFESGLEAEEKTGIDRKNISSVLNNKSITAGGYLWTFKGENPTPDDRLCYQYDLNGNLLNIYSTAEEAATTCCYDSKKIRDCCRGLRTEYNNFIWKCKKYENEEETKKKKNNGSKKVILLNNNTIFDSIKEASLFIGVDRAGITRCCNGTKKSAGKMPNGEKAVWAYYEE